MTVQEYDCSYDLEAIGIFAYENSPSEICSIEIIYLGYKQFFETGIDFSRIGKHENRWTGVGSNCRCSISL
jgi:hypothetical protein